MKVVSFNINGIRARPHQLGELVRLHAPEVIGLQETKVHDDMFPIEIPTALGYETLFHGGKAHYGVALMSTIGIQNPVKGYPTDQEDAQRRFVGITVEYRGQPLTIYNGYFPQGESRDHPIKFPNKRNFYADLLAMLKTNHSPTEQIVVMGDFNIAPVDADIGIGDNNKKRWLRTGKCSFLPEEREWFTALTDWGFTDSYRHLYPDSTEKLSWFDYRSKGFNDTPKRGLRIDHALVTAPLLPFVEDVLIDYDIRAMEKPSDHCPVILQLANP